MENKQLFLVHLGYYDKEISNGLYESHVNIFVVASDFNHARDIAKENELVKKHKMHIDGLQRVEMIQGYQVSLNPCGGNDTIVENYNFRELAPKTKKT